MSQNRLRLDKIAQRAQEIVNAETMVVALAESEGEIVYYAAAIGKHALVDIRPPGRICYFWVMRHSFSGLPARVSLPN